MFDVGFTELMLVGLVALIVLGPERLPVAARMAGLWIGRIKRSFSTIKAEVEREIGADEIRRQLHNERILDLEKEMKRSIAPSPSPSPSPSAPPPPVEPVKPDPASRPDKSPEP